MLNHTNASPKDHKILTLQHSKINRKLPVSSKYKTYEKLLYGSSNAIDTFGLISPHEPSSARSTYTNHNINVDNAHTCTQNTIKNATYTN